MARDARFLSAGVREALLLLLFRHLRPTGPGLGTLRNRRHFQTGNPPLIASSLSFAVLVTTDAASRAPPTESWAGDWRKPGFLATSSAPAAWQEGRVVPS